MSGKPPPDMVYSFKGDQTEVHCLNFLLARNEEKILSGTRTGEVFEWDLESLCLSQRFKAGEGSCISVLVPDDETLVTHSRGDAVRSWRRRLDGSLSAVVNLPASSLLYCAAQLMETNALNKKCVVYPCGEAKQLRVAELCEGNLICKLNYSEKIGSIMGLCSAGDGLVLAVFEAGHVILWDVRMTEPVSSLQLDTSADEMDTTMCIAFSAEKLYGLVGTSSLQVLSFSLTEARALQSVPSVNITNAGVNSICFRSDNKLVASAGWDSSVRVFAARSVLNKAPLRPLAVLPSHTDGKSLACTAFSQTPVKNLKNNYILAAGGDGCTICLWDIYNSK